MSSRELGASQLHSGSGDNVAGNKYVNLYQSIAPEALQKPLELILSDIRQRNPVSARTRLETVKSTGTLDVNSELILDALSFHLNLLDDKEKIKLHSSLFSIINNPSENLIFDLSLATLIRLDVDGNRIEDARKRFLKFGQPGPCSQETFYELVATSDELVEAYKKNEINLRESELTGIARGLFRSDNLHMALTVSTRLNSIFPSFNSKVLVLIAKGATLFNEKLSGTFFWTITATLKSELMEIIEETVSLIIESNGEDKRLFNVAAPSLQYVLGSHKKLQDICWSYVKLIEETHPEVAALLHNFYNNDSSKINNALVRDYYKAQENQAFREKLSNDLDVEKEIATDKFIILKDLEPYKIKQWVEAGGIVSGEDKLETDFCNLQLSLIALPKKNNHTAIEKLRIKSEIFLNNYREKLSHINPPILLELTEKLLIHPELSFVVSNLIKPLLPTSDLWLSPIVKCYLNALLHSEQTSSLAAVLNKIAECEWDSDLWIIQAGMFEQIAKYTEAIQAIEKALELDTYSLHGWFSLIKLHRLLKYSDEIVFSVLQRIPDKVLLKKSDVGLMLLSEIAKTGDFNRAERLILSWFIEDPSACAVSLSNFNFSLTIDNKNNLIGNEQVGDCVCGVVYTENNVQFTKLLVNKDVSRHPGLLNIGSPLGNFLSNMVVDETKTYGMHDYRLLERLPAYVAAFRISLELRQSENDGSDCFFAFQLPDDPKEMVSVLEKIMSRSQGRGDDAIVNNLDIPIVMRGNFLHRDDPLRSALMLWSTKKCSKHQFPNFGETAPAKIILDVYAIAYLALTGLAFGITKTSVQFVITQETKHFIEEWLKQINRENYLSIGVRPEGGLWRETADDIKASKQHRQINESLSLIIAESEIITPLSVDLPTIMLHMQDFIDISVYSSMKLSISNDIPWLCVDSLLAQLFLESGFKTANTFMLFTELGSSISMEQKKDGLYMHAEEIIPYALTFQDLRLLSASDDEYAHYFLAKLIYLYPKAFTETNVAIEILSSLLTPVLAKAFLDGEILKGLRVHNARNNGYAEKVFNACSYVSMQCNDVIESELSLATFLNKLFTIFAEIPPMIKLICVMATAFARGHFLSIQVINQHISNLEIA
jgi:hypothetical protein